MDRQDGERGDEEIDGGEKRRAGWVFKGFVLAFERTIYKMQANNSSTLKCLAMCGDAGAYVP